MTDYFIIIAIALVVGIYVGLAFNLIKIFRNEKVELEGDHLDYEQLGQEGGLEVKEKLSAMMNSLKFRGDIGEDVIIKKVTLTVDIDGWEYIVSGRIKE